jgi:outer membrane murein-binding lipoprotein Lpp
MQSAESGAVIKKGGGFREFFEDVNILDITISAFIVASVLYSVHYYRYMLMLEKSGYQDLSARLGKIESAVEAKRAEMNAAGKMKNRRPAMRMR